MMVIDGKPCLRVKKIVYFILQEAEEFYGEILSMDSCSVSNSKRASSMAIIITP